MATQKQINANRENAKHSTGPRSVEGKQIVSGNRIQHGILSNKLLLENESSADYQSLLDGLQSQLKPVGALEQVLVEKIAMTLWRQQRLVRAETATITLDSNPGRIANVIESGLGLSGFGNEKIAVEDLQPPDQEQYDWCKAVVHEFNAADNLDLKNLSRKAPFIYEQLGSDADADEESIKEYLSEIGLEGYLQDLLEWCQDMLLKLERKVEIYPAVIAMSETAKDKLSIPWGRLDLLNKYQTSLDNQLYKVMKALQDAQEWRLKILTANVIVETSDPAEAA